MNNKTLAISLVGIALLVLAAAIGVIWVTPLQKESSNLLGVTEQASEVDLPAGQKLATAADHSRTTASEPRGQRNTVASDLFGWAFVSLSIMAVVTLAAVVVAFYLYRWRRVVLDKQHLVVPEEFNSWIIKVSEVFNDLAKQVGSAINRFELQGQATHKGVADLTETFMTLQGAIDEREAEIRRLKHGYDAEIFRKFVSRFIRVDQAVEDFQKMGSADQSDLEQIRRLLEDAFAECGVECFQPQVGEDYRHAEGVADNPKSEMVDRPEEAFKIAEVLESGYLIRGTESNDVLVPARVKIYAYHEREGS